ncbi:MGSSK1 [Sanghuangporus vaninii]
MENNILPAVRVPTVSAVEGEDGDEGSGTPIVDLPPSEKFGFAFPDNPIITPVLPGNAYTSSAETEPSEPEMSEAESQESHNSLSMTGGKDSADHTPTNETSNSNPTSVPSPSPPRLSRAFSMPLPSQLGHLKNPHRTPLVNTVRDAYLVPPSPLALAELPNTRLQELSVELADSVEMVIQTLLQVSPPHLLDPAKEQFSACSLSVPSPSISAMLTAMKNLNYMSANMSTLADDFRILPSLSTEQETSSPRSSVQNDFDIGELLQSVGDSLSGTAAQAGVELVLYHADVGMKHVSVRGDECGISYALSHIIKQILNTAQSGDTLEVGLAISVEARESVSRTDSSNGESRSLSRASSVPDYDGPLHCTFDVGHKFASTDAAYAMENNPHITAGSSLFRTKPRLDTVLFRRLIQRIGGTVKEDLEPRMFAPGRSCELSVLLEPGSAEILSQPPKLSPEEQALRQPYSNINIQLASEPSLEELLQFAETLKGKKVVLHASAKGSFAHHLTSYLTTWGLDVSHTTMAVSEEDTSDAASAGPASNMDDTSRRTSPSVIMTDSPAPIEVNPVEEQLRQTSERSSASFVIIDDDVDVLRNRLLQLRSEPVFNLKRPKLAAYHRPKSSPQIVRAKGLKQLPTSHQNTSHPVIIHFTSLQNYRLVKDLINTILSSPSSSGFIPEIIVLPKPAGPRRVLTALRTAVVKPIVDPFFSPIATSPMSPNGQGVNPFSPFAAGSPASRKSGRPTISPRTTSDRSLRSSKDGVEIVQRLPPSPLRESDSLEYFAEAAEKLGTSPSSGLVIQSPDGQPAGIFFHPRGAGPRHRTEHDLGGSVISPPTLVRDAGNLRPPGERRSSLYRRGTMQLLEDDMSPGERPKPISKPKGPSRNRSGHTYFGDATVALPGAYTPITSPGQRRKKVESPRGELSTPPQSANFAPATPAPVAPVNETLPPQPSPGSHTDRKPMSPPTSPAPGRGGTGKRGFSRRGTAETPVQSPGASASRRGKLSVDGNIVPPISVLIVEDNPINQTILSTFMRKKKIKYDVAKNGAEAVTKWKTGGFHLILMDIQMPVMDGIEATKEIRKLEQQASGGPFASTPPPDGEQTPSDAPSSESKSTTGTQTPFRSSVIIVALTASSLQTDRVAALAAGCNDFLTKPVSLLWLNNKIIEWGSIKALQMWADLRPEVVRNLASGQANQAKTIASRLHVPESRRNRSPLTNPQSSSRATPAQIEAMRKLSSATRIPLSRGLDAVESDHSDLESRTAALSSADTRVPNTPVVGTETGSSGSSSVPADTPPEEKDKMAVSPREGPKEVSGYEALRVHIKDSMDSASSIAKRVVSGRSVILGERTMSGTPASIAELMHDHAEADSRSAVPRDTNVDSSEVEAKNEVPEEQVSGTSGLADNGNLPHFDQGTNDS